ncbi:inhibitor of growth protein 3 isoform X2 [Lepeophtheirus salmonis]|uniref:inhibitor of growth protein 3 isoform X2 n=1 Tax=Lepeophtheirus salmonis TaxID=72036 RepID=UPI001AE19FDE|nr:inhibitor of growth protein 3-like isoform X2 [Lepeophtheirus salmonis]
MLYLEDYLENRVDSLEERQKSFFTNCKRYCPSEREDELVKIRKEYKKVGEEASEKISIAEDCYSLVDRYLRKLDQELHKFKLELEADNRGITEVLEKRSLEMDAPAPNALKENRFPRKHNRKYHSTNAHTSPLNALSLGPSQLTDRKNNHYSGLVEGMIGSSTDSSPLNQTTIPLQHMGPGGNAIAAAASQAIQATQQLVPGRRTSSLKASYEAINLGVQAHEFSIGRELAGAAQNAIAATALGQPVSSIGEGSGNNPAKRQKISKRSSTVTSDSTPQQVLDVVNGGGGSSSLVDEPLLDPSLIGGNSPSTEELLSAGSSQDQEWNYDPSEPRYCICNQVSYGDMVACDNQDCPYEWFHYPCVTITAPPKGKWYCPTCSANMARRKGRK